MVQPESKPTDVGRGSRNFRPRDKKDHGSAVKQKPLAPVTVLAPAHPSTLKPPSPAPPLAALPELPSTPPSALARSPITTPTTPSLKIRLPRLSGFSLQPHTVPMQTRTRSSSSSSAQN